MLLLCQSECGTFPASGIPFSKKGAAYAFYTVCNADISIAGGGMHEVKRHCDTAKHTELLYIVNQASLLRLLKRLVQIQRIKL